MTPRSRGHGDTVTPHSDLVTRTSTGCGNQKASGKGQRMKGSERRCDPSQGSALLAQILLVPNALSELLLHHKPGMKQFSALPGEPLRLGKDNDLFTR